MLRHVKALAWSFSYALRVKLQFPPEYVISSEEKVQTGFKVHTTSSLMGIVAISQEKRWPRRETGQSSRSVKVKNEYRCPSTLHFSM
jgi:hypothetical protein